MPRPPRCRLVQETPTVTYFKPQGVPLRELAEVALPVDSFEAIRLADLDGLGMEEAAARMHVSRHTFGRILADGRRAVANALVNGRALRIAGGCYAVRPGAEKPAETPVRSEEPNMTKIAVTSEGPTLHDQVDPRFGRAAGFVVVDLETMQTQYVDNGASQAMAHGAGISAAERISASGAQVVLTGFVGPKAFTALSAAGIKVGQDLEGITVAQAVERYQAGQVKIADQANK
jgi:predicted DNA-binding protein (UPF0251 family)/predicted Fe-Mo cluster-binding NifX family protein